jgi:hypothetical protein
MLNKPGDSEVDETAPPALEKPLAIPNTLRLRLSTRRSGCIRHPCEGGFSVQRLGAGSAHRRDVVALVSRTSDRNCGEPRSQTALNGRCFCHRVTG